MKLWGRDLSRLSPWQAVPGLAELRGYRLSALRDDIIAGITVAAVAVPSGLGMGELAGVDPVAGLYATAFPLIGYALFGSSRQLIVGPTGAVAALTASTIATLAGSDDPARAAALATALAAITGVFLIIAAVFRLGSWRSSCPTPSCWATSTASR